MRKDDLSVTVTETRKRITKGQMDLFTFFASFHTGFKNGCYLYILQQCAFTAFGWGKSSLFQRNNVTIKK